MKIVNIFVLAMNGFILIRLWLKKIRDLMDRADAGEWTVKDLLFQEVPEEIVPIER